MESGASFCKWFSGSPVTTTAGFLFGVNDKCQHVPSAGSKKKLDILKTLTDQWKVKCNFDPCESYGAIGVKPACCPKKLCQESQAINRWIWSKADPAWVGDGKYWKKF